MDTSEKQFPFLEKSTIRPLWNLGSKTCTVLDAEEFALSTDRTASPLRNQPPPPPPPKKPPKPRRPPKSLIEGFLDFHE